MTAYLAIVKLTCRSAMRSNIFRTLLFLLLLAVVLIPNTIKGDGTAMGFVQIMLEYSLSFIALILAISAAWVACSEIATDVENSQLHLIAVKPVSRITILLGKFSGVILIHGILLLIASAVVYGFIMMQLGRQEFSEDDLMRLNNEVLTGRRLYKPEQPDFDKLAVEELNRRVDTMRQHGQTVSQAINGEDRRKILETTKKELIGKNGEIAPGEYNFWTYQGLPDDLDKPFFLRYKMFIDGSSSQNQSTTRGSWLIRAVFPVPGDNGAPTNEVMEQRFALQPVEIITASTDEFGIQEAIARDEGATDDNIKELNASVLSRINRNLVHDGTFIIGYANFDPAGKPAKIQESDGPFLLVQETGFLNNYIRVILVMLLGIMAISLIASALAAYFTLPTAVFLTVSYAALSFFGRYLLKAFAEVEGVPLRSYEKVGKILSDIVSFLLMPIQDFLVTTQLATGQLVEFAYIENVLLNDLVLRGLPFLLLGAWLYWSRELGIAAKR